MNIVINPSPIGKPLKNKLQTRFDKLRHQLLKQQTLNQKFQDELDELVTVYQTQLLQVDTEQVAPLSRLVTKLIDFYSRKSLSRWHREELWDWIFETLGRIGRVEPETADELHGLLRQVVASQMDMTVAELDEEARQHTESAAETMFNVDEPQEGMFGFDDNFAEGAADEQFFAGDNTYGIELENSKARRKQLMDGSWVRNLFRRAAQALHPDREPDPKKRQTKERSMQQLLAARKQGDILTLLSLYSECIDGDDLVLAEQEITSACELMKEQLDDLRLEKAAFIYEHPLRELVHDLFYSGSRKTREKRIQAWKYNLKAEAEQTLGIIEELRNLKVLKIFLEERQEERCFSVDTIINNLWQ